MKIRSILLAAALLAPSSAWAQEKLNVEFSQNSRNGVCYVGFPGPNAPGTDKPMSIEFSYRVRDGNMATTINVNGWERAQAKAGGETPIPMVVAFDGGKTRPSRSGGYDSGFNDSAWGGWGPGELSAPLLENLKTSKKATVEFDGMKLGPFDLQMKSLAYTSLTDCAERVKAGKE